MNNIAQSDKSDKSFLGVITNYEPGKIKNEKGDWVEIKKPLSIQTIFREIQKNTKGWPKMCGQQMFVNLDGEFEAIRNAAHLFAFLQSKSTIEWYKGRDSQFVTEAQIYEYLQMHSEKYDYATSAPHYPPIKKTYYLKSYEPRSTGKLAQLLDMFKPESNFDRQLLEAMFLTPFWGGPAGRRPAFILTAPENDPKGGRGVGKTMITDVLSRITGGFVDFTLGEKFDQMKTRMIHARNMRIVRFDNVKQEHGRESSTAEIEGLITSSIISGKELFKGEGQMPNIWTYIFTFNQAELTEDMAQRAVVIKLGRPEYTKNWEERLDTFIELYKDEIIVDCLAILGRDEVNLGSYNRFTAWSRQVLSKCSDEGILEYIAEEQEKHNAEKNFAEHVEDMFASRISAICNAETSDWVYTHSNVFIESAVIVRWYQEDIARNASKIRITKNLKGLNVPWLFYGRQCHKSGFLVKLRREIDHDNRSAFRIHYDDSDQLTYTKKLEPVYNR